MKRVISLFAVILLCDYPLMSEYLFLTDGSIIKGQVLKESSSEITFRDTNNRTGSYPRSRIIRVLYTELNMSRLYVRLRTGQTLRVFMVDEDRETYVFRNELNKPEEFRINRADVLFMAEMNPSALKGNPGIESVSLQWLPSYEEMKYYNIYIRKDGEKYTIAAESKNTEFILEGLKGNTDYTVKVTGVSKDGEETSSSNEFQFRTKNHPPDSPSGLTKSLMDNGDIVLTWSSSNDPDGKIIKYMVYGETGGERKLIGETKGNSYSITAGSNYERVMVTAVDDMNAESPEVDLQLNRSEYTLAFMEGVIFPLGRLGELAGIGCGGSITFSKRNLFWPGIEAGASVGFYYMEGKDSPDKRIIETGHALLLPVQVNVGYRFTFTESLSLELYITSGAALLYLPYVERDSITLLNVNKSLTDFGPVAGAGISFNYSITESIDILIHVEQDFMPEDMLSGFSSTRFNIGQEIRF